MKKLPKPVHLVTIHTTALFREWFKQNFVTVTNRANLMFNNDKTRKPDLEVYDIWANPDKKRGQAEVGYVKIYKSGEITVVIFSEFSYLFDETEELFHKMAEG